MSDNPTLNFLTSALNSCLALDPETPEKLRAFDGKVICIEILGPNRRIYLSINADRMAVVQSCETEPDATISGSPTALFRLGMHRDAAPLFFTGDVVIQGDTRLGRQFKSLLADMDIDWEEHLSRLVGDMAAHRVFELFNELRTWSKTAADHFANDLGEYLQEESRDVVSEAEMGMFYQQVDRLRDDTDRLEARINRLSGVGAQ